ncbi:MAG TPA: hypothetical protein VGP30_00060 [Candidatus Limnocylindrales bacterium]|nr:hypothetical protein [Candidatus Limnocylindrales bacterium]
MAADIIRAMVVGIVLLAQLDVSTSTLQSSLFMLVLGIGIGCVMQVIMLLAENSVEQRDMGVASSTSTFTRSIGGAFGVAIFGAIFSAQLHSGLENVGASGVASGTGQIDPATLDELPPSCPLRSPRRDRRGHQFRLRLGDDLRVAVFLLAVGIKAVPLCGDDNGLVGAAPEPESVLEPAL